ncbi:hypothetical protein ACFLVH_03350 [Chloroflexota bacterium]
MSRYNLKLIVVRFLKEVPRLMLAPIVVGMVALLLYLSGMVPAYLQGVTGIKAYNSIEAAESELGFEILVPAYFPSYLAWPPAEIRGQLEPFPMVQMLFLSYDQHTETLLIYQMASSQKELPVALPWFKAVLQETPVDINGSKGKLVVGERADGQQVNGVYWVADDFHFIVVMAQPVRELLTLASSMTH